MLLQQAKLSEEVAAMTEPTLHGVVAEFVTPDGLVNACKKPAPRYRRMDATRLIHWKRPPTRLDQETQVRC